MAKKIINIDGYIGAGGFSAQYVKNALAESPNDEVELRINSLGGDVGHAIAIKDALQAHGNVTALYSGASASSATIISTGCKSVKMTKDSFYLVHKPMVAIDIWDALDEDQLKDLIAKLSNDLDNASKFTLQIAGMYCDKTGKTASEILAIMKKGTWMTAEEVKNLGFIDEVITPDKMTAWGDDEKLVAMIAGNDMPPLPRRNTAAGTESTSKLENALDNFISKLTNLFSNNSKTNTEMSKTKIYALLCLAIALDELEVDDKGSTILNKGQLDQIEAEFKKLQDAKALAESNLTAANSARDTAVNALTAANTAKDAAVTALATVTTALDELDVTIKAVAEPKAKVEAVRAKLAEKPGAAATGARTVTDQTHKPIAGADPVTAYAQGIV